MRFLQIGILSKLIISGDTGVVLLEFCDLKESNFLIYCGKEISTYGVSEKQ